MIGFTTLSLEALGQNPGVCLFELLNVVLVPWLMATHGITFSPLLPWSHGLLSHFPPNPSITIL